MEKAYIAGGARSYIGIENSMYRNIPAEILGAKVLKYVIGKYQCKEPDMVIAGNATGAGAILQGLWHLKQGFQKKYLHLQ